MIADLITLIDIAIWVWIASVVILTAAAGVAAFLLVRLACIAIARAYHRRWHYGPHDVGPDALQLLEDLDQHLDELVAADPDLAAGFDRLRSAVRDEQKKGETT